MPRVKKVLTASDGSLDPGPASRGGSGQCGVGLIVWANRSRKDRPVPLPNLMACNGLKLMALFPASMGNIPLRFEHQVKNASGDARDLALAAVENTMVVELVLNGTIKEAFDEFVADLLILDHQGPGFLKWDV